MDPGFLLLAGIATLLEPGVSVNDLDQFPPHVVAVRCHEAARRARCIIAARESVEPYRGLHWWRAKCEAATAEEAWATLLAAQNARAGEGDCLATLARLRAMLGWRDYGAGRMPCPVPLWALPRCDDPRPDPFVPVVAYSAQ